MLGRPKHRKFPPCVTWDRLLSPCVGILPVASNDIEVKPDVLPWFNFTAMCSPELFVPVIGSCGCKYSLLTSHPTWPAEGHPERFVEWILASLKVEWILQEAPVAFTVLFELPFSRENIQDYREVLPQGEPSSPCCRRIHIYIYVYVYSWGKPQHVKTWMY